MGKLDGKIALVTGGNSGIGFAAAKLFKSEGARLIVTGRNRESLDEACRILGEDVLALVSDAGDVAQIEALMAQVGERFGKLDVLFVNAAIAKPMPFDMVDEAIFDETVRINLKGAYFTIQKALGILSGNASVIVTTSISNQMGSPNFSVYAACKAALRNLVQTLGLELVKRGVRVNAISPGPIETPMWGRFGLPPEMENAIRQAVIDKSPVGRYGTPDEVAKVALFLASDDASYVTGQEIAAALAVSEARIFGRGVDIRAIRFLIESRRAVEAGADIETVVLAALKRERGIAGYGRPIASGDERIAPILALAAETGCDGGVHLRHAFAVESILAAGRWRLKMNYAAVAAALAADLGFSPREYYFFGIPAFFAGMPPCYLEASEKKEGTTFPLPCDVIQYEGDGQSRSWDVSGMHTCE